MTEFYRKKDDENYIIEILSEDRKTHVLTVKVNGEKITKISKGTLIRYYDFIDANVTNKESWYEVK